MQSLMLRSSSSASTLLLFCMPDITAKVWNSYISIHIRHYIDDCRIWDIRFLCTFSGPRCLTKMFKRRCLRWFHNYCIFYKELHTKTLKFVQSSLTRALVAFKQIILNQETTMINHLYTDYVIHWELLYTTTTMSFLC